VKSKLTMSASNPLSLEGRGRGEGGRQELTPFAKQLRKTSTDAERLLWSRLRAGRCEGMKFRRQQPIGRYIVDFVCLERRLVIELDGGQHARPDEVLRDREREEWLEKEGYTILRFWNTEVLANIMGVLEVIRATLLERSPSP
jgi:very-short-patch-repair endonuclease